MSTGRIMDCVVSSAICPRSYSECVIPNEPFGGIPRLRDATRATRAETKASHHFAQNDNRYLPLRGPIQHVSFHRIEGVGGIGKPPIREVLLDFLQELVSLGIACELHSNAALVVRRCCPRCAKIAAGDSPQPRQCRPTDLVHHA